jgi:hypothetical protein
MNVYKVLVENLKGRDHFSDLDTDGRIKLRWILKAGRENADWIHLTQWCTLPLGGPQKWAWGVAPPKVPELPSARGYSWATLSPGVINRDLSSIKKLLLQNLKRGGQGPIWAVGPLDGWMDGWCSLMNTAMNFQVP